MQGFLSFSFKFRYGFALALYAGLSVVLVFQGSIFFSVLFIGLRENVHFS